MPALVVGIGEVLWDIFPEDRRMGGAPANFAYHTKILGNEGVVVSRVGNDELGRLLIETLEGKGMDVSYIQTGNETTGTVEVTLQNGDTKFNIAESVAWDTVEWTDGLANLAARTEAVCFSTLSQRSPKTRSTVNSFLDATSGECLRVLDVNLRPPYVNEGILRDSVDRATVVKYNDQESAYLSRLFDVGNMAEWLIQDRGKRLVCETRGAAGCAVHTSERSVVVPGDEIDVSKGDPVGAGDAFTAAVVRALLEGLDPVAIGREANRYAARVASKRGGMPDMGDVPLGL